MNMGARRGGKTRMRGRGLGGKKRNVSNFI